MQERVQKIIARTGLYSRREADRLIADGSVTVNGQVIRPGAQADSAKDAIKVKGKLLSTKTNAGGQQHVYYAFHKPKGIISMMNEDPEGRPTLLQYFRKMRGQNLFPVGRLGFNIEGLLLMTSDGDFMEKLIRHPEVVRVYEVKVRGHPEEAELQRLLKGAKIEDEFVKPYSLSLLDKFTNKSRIEIAFKGTGHVDVKTYFEAKGFLVGRIVRIAVGQIELKGLEPGKFRLLKKSQAFALIEQPELGLRSAPDPDAPLIPALVKPVQRQIHKSHKKDLPAPSQESAAPRKKSNTTIKLKSGPKRSPRPARPGRSQRTKR